MLLHTLSTFTSNLSFVVMLGSLVILSSNDALAQRRNLTFANSCVPVQPYGDIGKTWQALQQELGCPLEAETGGTDGFGRSQRFRFGQVTWSAPQRGHHSVLAAYQAGSNAIELQWAGLEPFAYDFLYCPDR